jgi:hypothetical protein
VVFSQRRYALAANTNALSVASNRQYHQPETNIQSGYVSENAKAERRQRRACQDAYVSINMFCGNG